MSASLSSNITSAMDATPEPTRCRTTARRVFRRTTEGFAKGNARIDSTNGSGTLELTFQNEHLIALHDGEVRGIVPDLICVLESETAEPITTESIRYGQRVKVMVVSTPAIMRTPEALEVFGPRAFGLDYDFTPIEDLAD